MVHKSQLKAYSSPQYLTVHCTLRRPSHLHIPLYSLFATQHGLNMIVNTASVLATLTSFGSVSNVLATSQANYQPFPPSVGPPQVPEADCDTPQRVVGGYIASWGASPCSRLMLPY
jgi:hypothetical protein